MFQGPTFVIIIMIDTSENTFVKVAFELRVCMFLKSAGMDRVSWRIVLKDSIRNGPLENLWGGGRSTKKKFAQGKIK